MSSLAIKPAGPAHIPDIIRIQEATWGPTYREILSSEQIEYMVNRQYSPESLQSQMDGGHRFHLLECDGIYGGFASCSGPYADGGFQLHKIYVLPSLQGSGAGRFLLASMEAVAREAGAGRMRLNVNRHNKARRFYEKMGYTVLYEEDIPIGPYWMNDYVMEKNLNEAEPIPAARPFSSPS